MPTLTEQIQANIRALTGTNGMYNEDWHALCDLSGIPNGQINERILAYYNSFNAGPATIGSVDSYFKLNPATVTDGSAIAVLRAHGTNAHVYLPGIGVLNGLTAGNYLDSAGTTAATIDQPVGLVLDAQGGINAIQATTANKPILRRGAVNLLTYSQALQTGFTPSNSSLNSGILDPYGSVNAYSLIPTAVSGSHGMVQSVGSVGSVYTLSCYAKSNGYTNLQLYADSSGNFNATFDLNTGVAASSGGATVSMVDVGGGWYLCAAAFTQVSSNRLNIQGFPAGATANNFGYTFTGNGVSGVNIYRSFLTTGTYTAQQIQALGGIPLTTTAPASTALGPYSWDTSGGKSLGATFPTGNESVTVIDAPSTGQVTTTAVNVVGAYNISTPTSGRIIVNGALSTPDLSLLQKLANKLAGL